MTGLRGENGSGRRCCALFLVLLICCYDQKSIADDDFVVSWTAGCSAALVWPHPHPRARWGLCHTAEPPCSDFLVVFQFVPQTSNKQRHGMLKVGAERAGLAEGQRGEDRDVLYFSRCWFCLLLHVILITSYRTHGRVCVGAADDNRRSALAFFFFFLPSVRPSFCMLLLLVFFVLLACLYF